jgi:hypothetical protein
MAETNRLWVKCGPCGHVWAALHLPMPLNVAATAMKRTYCPSCAETKKIFLAQEVDIPKEAAHG